MKLVQILARELKDWPEYKEYGKILYITQGGNSAILAWEYEGLSFRVNSWVSTMGLPTDQILYGSEMAFDHATAIVTRADWEAERARIAEKAAELHMRQEREKLVKPKPAKKASAEGWVRHRGGRCPVDEEVVVDVRFRSGAIETNNGWPRWKHNGDGRDIMAYRIHKPADQPEEAERLAPFITVSGDDSIKMDIDFPSGVIHIDGPLQWRDRIREIDAEVTQRNEAHRQVIEALEEERASFVQRLEDEGLRLI